MFALVLSLILNKLINSTNDKTATFDLVVFVFMKEIFKDIPNYEGMYQVSNLGNVKSLKGGKELILKPINNCYGYLYCSLYKEKKVKVIKVHQLVTMAFLNHVPNGRTLVVNHINHIKTDNRLENLEIVTTRENANKKQFNWSSEYTGVSWDKKNKKWRSQISVNCKVKYLGYFDCELKASYIYQNALKQILL